MKIEVGQFWQKSTDPDYIYEVTSIIKQTDIEIISYCKIWYRSCIDNYYVLTIEPHKTLVHWTDFNKWKQFDFYF